MIEEVGIIIEGGIDVGPFTQWTVFLSDSSTTDMYYWWTDDSTAGYHVLSMGTSGGNIGDVKWMPSPAVQDANNPPFAIQDNVFIIEDQMLVIDVQANDYDIDGDPLTTNITSQPVNGVAVVLGGNTIEYTPDQDYFGTDIISYEVCDTGANMLCSGTTVEINIASINDAPVAVNDSGYSTNPSGTIGILVQANDMDADGDALSTAITSLPGSGTVVVLGDESIEFTADTTFVGDVTFNYEVCDDSLACDEATVFVKVVVSGVQQVEIRNEVEVYPNPAMDMINVKLNTSARALFELFNLEGKRVLSVDLLSKEISISLQGIRPATYI